MKKIISFLLILFSLFLLIGCGDNGGITPKPNGGTDKEVVAKLDSSKQGTYYGDDVTVVITESQVSVTDPSGKTLSYTIYIEGDKYYILEEGNKVYCTFGDGTVTNNHGTFTKRSGGNTDTVAKLDSSKQGTYYGDDVRVVIGESKVSITDPTGKTLEFTIYVEGDKYYILEEGNKVYCTFGDGTVTNKHGTFSKNGGSSGETIAKLDSSKQGTYYGDGVTVVITESQVSVTDPSGKTLRYTIYVEGNKYYILEDGNKVYCTFGDGTVTNNHGTFRKQGGNSGSDTPANIPTADQGDYFAGPMKITVYASKVIVYEGSETMEFNLYVEDGKIYFYDSGVKFYCEIGNGVVKNGYGTFTRDGGMETVSASEAARKFANFLGLNTDFRIPDGTSVQDSMVEAEDANTYAVVVVNPKEAYSAYLEYFTGIFVNLGYTQTATTFMKMDNDILGAAIDFDQKTSTLTIAATIIKGMGSDEIDASEFIALCKEKFDIELNFPETISKIQDKYYSEDYGLGNLLGSFKLDGVNTITERDFSDLVGRLDAKLAPKGFVKGEVEIKKYANAYEMKIQWTNSDYDYVLLEMVEEDGDYNFNINIFASVAGGSQTGGDSWPADDIKSFYSNLITIPNFTGEFESVFVNKEADNNALNVSLTDVSNDDFEEYIEVLETFGFNETGVNFYTLYLDSGHVVSITAFLSQNVASFTFKLEAITSDPWPSEEIARRFGADVATLIPALDDGGKASYSTSYANDMLVISVNGGLQTDLIQKYITQLRNSRFVDGGSNSFEYTLENNNVIEIMVYSTSSAQNTFTISIELDKYVGMEYNLPENFVAQINDNGFSLIKIGESYVYRYTYSNAYTKIEVFLYDSTKNQWQHSIGTIILQAGASGITWENYGTNTAPVNYQYVSRPQVDEFLSGTNGLAYSYYEKLLDNSANATKDPTKNTIIAGAMCEYVTFKESMGSYYTATTELWIEPNSKMIYKVDYTLQMSGQTQKSTPFEIKSMDFSKTSLQAAGIGNCMLPGFDKTTATDNDHTYGEVQSIGATCGTDGEEYVICTCCGEKKVLSTTPATGEHVPETYNLQPVWYSDNNGHHYQVCTKCHEHFNEEDCQYTEWVVDEVPTCKRVGRRFHTCTVCRDKVYEDIPIDPNGHTYVGTYTTNVTIVLPTKEADGSITWACREECGHTEVITLPKLDEANYIMGVYEDFLTNKNYYIYGLKLDEMIAEMNKFMSTQDQSTSSDSSYITYTLFGLYDEFVYNYDFVNPIYGFLGEEIPDELASIPEKYRGELFDYENNKLVLGENTLALTMEGETKTYTLYVRDGAIYFGETLDGYTYTYTVTLNDDGSVTLDNYGDFEKRVVAKLSEEYLGEYYGLDDDENEIKVEVLISCVKVMSGNDVSEYVLYVKDEDYYIISEENEIVYCYFDEESVSNDFGTFTRKTDDEGEEGGEEGEEDNTEFPFDAVSEYLATEEFKMFTYDGATYSSEVADDYVAVRIDLPEEADKSEVLADFIGMCEGYSEEYGYYDLDNGYGLYMYVHEENNAVILMYYPLD